MKKHIVLGCYRFVGYHLCEFLLETGEEVIGLDWNSGMDEDEREEKALSFGRNSNFTFYPIENRNTLDIEADSIIHVPYYDFDDLLLDIKEQIKGITDEVRSKGNVIIEIYPFREELIDEEEKIRLLAPTIYGPWQPKGALIRSLLSGESFSSLTGLLDDAIYVRDLVEDWSQIINLQPGVYELVSDLDHHLKSCLEHAGNKEEIPLLTTRISNRKTHKIHVKTKPDEGISKQKQHLEIQKKLQEWKKK
ncbi:hypothetical protein [Peribacillus acanthi]|uniref:hypothetical protein n=1 Tax=Peribacillus acanthi TaxID=2171554 RepID=UPI0013008C03|nr:hypothetical protein [Peribacillus acanthi]